MPRFCSFSTLKWHWMHPILKASRKILTFKYYDKFAFIQIRDSMGAHLIFFIIFTWFSCIILTNQSLPWYSLRSGFQCDTKMAAVFSGMRPTSEPIFLVSTWKLVFFIPEPVLTHNPKFQNQEISLSNKNVSFTQSLLVGNSLCLMPVFVWWSMQSSGDMLLWKYTMQGL